jgi:hypothetical protein
MITKLEKEKILLSLNYERRGTAFVSSAHGSSLRLEKEIDAILTQRVKQYRESSEDYKIGKSKFLHQVILGFVQDQKPLLRYHQINHYKFNHSVLTALSALKELFRIEVSKQIRTQSDTILALFVYIDTRLYEIHNGLKITDYIDDEYKDDAENPDQLLADIARREQIEKAMS